jgi:hypothetical protein
MEGLGSESCRAFFALVGERVSHENARAGTGVIGARQKEQPDRSAVCYTRIF